MKGKTASALAENTAPKWSCLEEQGWEAEDAPDCVRCLPSVYFRGAGWRTGSVLSALCTLLRVGLPLGVVGASLVKVVQGVVLPIGLQVPGQGLLLLAELGGHLLVHV